MIYITGFFFCKTLTRPKKKSEYEYYSSEFHVPGVCPVVGRSHQWKLLVMSIFTVGGRSLQSSNRPRRRRSTSAVLSGEPPGRSLCCRRRRRAAPEW